MERIRVVPGEVEDRIRKYAAFLLIQLSNPQENPREDFLIDPGLARRRHRDVLPLQPARRVHERSILLRESGARQAVDGRLNLVHLLGSRARRAPELAGFIGINLPHHEPVRLFQRLDVLPRVRSDLYSVHAEGEHPFHAALVHVVPNLGPRVAAIDLRQIVECPVFLLLRRVSVQRLEERHHELRRVRPVVKRVPIRRCRGSRRSPPQIGREIDIVRRRHFQIAGENVEDAGQVSSTLNVRVPAQRIDAAAGPSDVAEQELQHRGGADDLRPEGVLRPPDRIDDRGDLLHVAVGANRREQVGRSQKLIARDAGDPLDHLRRVARVVLLQQLKHAPRMLQRCIVRDSRRQGRHPSRLRAPRFGGQARPTFFHWRWGPTPSAN